MKGIAAKQVALLILAIIVVALIAFLLYKLFTGSSGMTIEECSGRVGAACTACRRCYLGNDCKWEGENVNCSNCVEICSYPDDCSQFSTEIGISVIAPDYCKKIGIV